MDDGCGLMVIETGVKKIITGLLRKNGKRVPKA
jgi:hypothetical protein